jgi:hypothetical protein
MEDTIQKIYMNEMSQQKMYKIFGLRQVQKMTDLTDWLSDLPELEPIETAIAGHYQKRLLGNINIWNEQELSLNFIGPIFAAIDFTVQYRLNWFAQRNMRKIIGDYELIGKPDGVIASGFHEPEIPYFSFQEFKKELDSSGDPIGQNLAAMMLGQLENGTNDPVFGCYVVGRFWFFMVLKDKDYAISQAFSATNEDIFDILKILKALRSKIFARLGIEEEVAV